jgi:Mg/Co/Ni transporter MgtE
VRPLPIDIDRFHGNVKLNISREKIANIHPVDLADIMEELSTEERVAIMDILDTETAADTLEEAEPRVQRDLVASLRRDRVAERLQTMTPAQIADLLEILPRIDAEALRTTLPAETLVTVNDLLQMHEIKLSTIATGRFLALPENATVKTALSRFRRKKTRYDVIMYVYVTAEDGTLKGVVDIRELIQNRSDARIGNIMTEQVVTLSPDSFGRCSRVHQVCFRALPMVDKDSQPPRGRVVQGSVGYDTVKKTVVPVWSL